LTPGQTAILKIDPYSPPNIEYTWTYQYVNSSSEMTKIATSQSDTIDVTEVGSYKVIATARWPSKSCLDTSNTIVIAAEPSERLFIYPSPNDGRFTVSYYNSGGASGQRWIRVYNGLGSLVYDRTFPIAGMYTLIPIDLQRMARGIYYVVVGDGSGKRLTEGKVHVR
jgi:hypothetical protein